MFICCLASNSVIGEVPLELLLPRLLFTEGGGETVPRKLADTLLVYSLVKVGRKKSPEEQKKVAT